MALTKHLQKIEDRMMLKHVAVPRVAQPPPASFLVVCGCDEKTVICDIYLKANGLVVGTIAYQRDFFRDYFELREKITERLVLPH